MNAIVKDESSTVVVVSKHLKQSSMWTGTDYKQRHDAVTKVMIQELLFKFQFLRHTVTNIALKFFVQILPRKGVVTMSSLLGSNNTDRQAVSHNRSDHVVFDKRKKIILLIDVTIPDIWTYKISSTRGTRWDKDMAKNVRPVPFVILNTAVIQSDSLQNVENLDLDVSLYKLMQKVAVSVRDLWVLIVVNIWLLFSLKWLYFYFVSLQNCIIMKIFYLRINNRPINNYIHS